MNLKNKNIMDEYHVAKKDFISLGNVVSELLHNIVKQSDIQVLAIEHRVKQEHSLGGKLELKGDKYKDLSVGNRERAQRAAKSLLRSGEALPREDR